MRRKRNNAYRWMTDNYNEVITAEEGEDMKICPIMSKAVLLTSEYRKPEEDLIRIKCQQKECALWVIEQGESKIPIERCGLIK